MTNKYGTVVGATIGIPVTFALEVLGAAGAVWGSSEVVGLRDDSNKQLWINTALVLGVAGLVRYGLKFQQEKSMAHRSQENAGFWASAAHAAISPHEAIADAFKEPSKISLLNG